MAASVLAANVLLSLFLLKGPVLSVLVERSTTKARSKLKRQVAKTSGSSTGSTSSTASAVTKLGQDLKSSIAGLAKVSSSGTHVVPEIEGVLMVTPLAIERYQLDGSIMKRAALAEPITVFLTTKIAGVGKVVVCGTQTGQVHILKSDLLGSMLVFDTGRRFKVHYY